MRKLLILLTLFVPVILHGETPKLPPEKELKAMAFDSLFSFNKAVQTKDFTQFYKERLSFELRKQVSLEKFSETFRVFIEKGYDILSIAGVAPVFDKTPAIDSDGILLLQGHYPSRPNKVTFTLKYVYTSPVWKLIGINVQAVPFGENTGTIPTTKELKAYVLDSLLTFNEAIQNGDFDDFYHQISKAWQKETTPKELLKIFQSFVDQKVDIGPIAKLDPTFDGTPTVNDDGHLVVSGSYPTPSKVNFELKYLNEENNWKLVGINVGMKSDDKAKKKDSDDDDDEEEDDE